MHRLAIKIKAKYVLPQMMDHAIYKAIKIAHLLIMVKAVLIIKKDGITL